MFNSRNPVFRNPTGAVPEGTRIHFRITVPRNLSCSAAMLIVEKDQGNRFVLDMFWCGMNGNDKEWWECHFTPEEKGLYFYNFELKTNRGHITLCKGLGGQATTGSHGNRWQLTAYSKELSTPDWLCGGILYQIFPDRFYCSGKEKKNVPKDRFLHENWGEQPVWWPNENGEITNSDYFGGDLKGIEEKLPYLKELGVTCLYLNPIFEAHSNHRYNTADYTKIDPLLGTEEDFISLCRSAERVGIRILLDGVFSHTGSDSIYFNREGRYGDSGAYRSQSSPYFPWYNFRRWPNDYESWWNFDTLPNVRENNPEYDSYINGENGIIQTWLQRGASGWRLDVADELPDCFLDHLHQSAKSQDPNALVLGEVWEDASNKTAYGIRRRYLLGGQLDTVMNYPFREAILDFLRGAHASLCMETIENIVENYPPECVRLLMNHIGTHDTERALTVLGGPSAEGRDRKWQSETHLSKEQKETALLRLRLASLLQFTLPGVPCIYYGDEAGMEGYKDPFNRGCYPWGGENLSLIQWYKRLASLRHSSPVFREGKMRNAYSHNSILSFERYIERENGAEDVVFIAVNRSENNASIPLSFPPSTHLLGTPYGEDFKLPPYGYSVFSFTRTPKDSQ